ncbi:mesothelin-like protein isoform X8 [Cavia porcellus]|uniref:mesothelin-like protein isoform X8 n=1 Tax=Cavia porcellus TaxID=10141 RepID=UPI002FE2CBF9
MTSTCCRSAIGPRVGALASPGLALLLSLTAHCSSPQDEGVFQRGLDISEIDPWASLLFLLRANTALLQDFGCHPAGQLPREQLSALLRSLASQHVPLQAWQLSCLANLASRLSLQDDFALHPPDLLLFYNLSQVKEANCRAFTHRAAQGNTELLVNLPDQRVALRHTALACLGGPHLQLSASDLVILGVLVCDMDASSIVTADPHVLQNLLRCPRLSISQQAALNTLLASGKTHLGIPGSWNLEELQALGPLTTYISPQLWEQVQEAVGLDFFRSMVAAFRVGHLNQSSVRRFVTSFLESRASSVSTRPKRGTGRSCIRGNITAATLQDDLFLVHYDCAQLESCLGNYVLRANLDPLLQHPLPAECQRIVKAKLTQIYPQGVPEDQLHLITSLVYLYSCAEIGQWNITSGDTVVTLLASDVALENQTEAVLQRFLDHNGVVTGALLVAIGGSRLCWMSPRQIHTIQPSEFRAGRMCSLPRPMRLSATPAPQLTTTASCAHTSVVPPWRNCSTSPRPTSPWTLTPSPTSIPMCCRQLTGQPGIPVPLSSLALQPSVATITWALPGPMQYDHAAPGPWTLWTALTHGHHIQDKQSC